MAKRRDLAAVESDLAKLADNMPTQHVPAREKRPKRAGEGRAKKPVLEQPAEPTIQFSFGLRRSLRKQLVSLANDADMTMRAFVLDALKGKGLDVADADLLDMRKEKG